ncbi:hypothetical protein BT69DRAFT_1353068 [Atractiella rhizophila]|nr:hypothetical protein BT69DRAFT_1353068 [Atractiella rhizophila]
MTGGLLGLPIEICILIADYLPLPSLSRFNRVCKALHDLSTPTLYRLIVGFNKDRCSAVRTVLEKPELIKHITHLGLYGAKPSENDDVHSSVIALLENDALQHNLESLSFSYSAPSHFDGWYFPEDLLTDNIIWETIETGNFTRLYELKLRNFPYGSPEDPNSLHNLTFWKKISLETHEHVFRDYETVADYDPYTKDLFDWLVRNKALTSLDLQLMFHNDREGRTTADFASIASLLETANWPSLVHLSLLGAYCHDADMVQEKFGYGPSPSVHRFFLAHPQLRTLQITSSERNILEYNNLHPEQTVPLAGIQTGAFSSLESFTGLRNHIEDLGKLGVKTLKRLVVLEHLSGMGWIDDEHHLPAEETFVRALDGFPNLEILEVYLPRDQLDVFRRLAIATPRLKRLILRGYAAIELMQNVSDAFQGHESLKILELKGMFYHFWKNEQKELDILVNETENLLRETKGNWKTVVFQEEDDRKRPSMVLVSV